MMMFFTSSCLFLLVVNLLFIQFQACVARPEDDKVQIAVQQEARIDGNVAISEGLNERIAQDETVKKCGISNRMGINKHELDFVSSSHSKAGEYPWTVAILRKLNHNSHKQTLLYSGAGSLIHPSVVLTAANKHHTTQMDLVRAGEWDFGVTIEEMPYQDRDISNIMNIDENDPDSVQLIFVSVPFVLALNVRTACLPFPGTSSISEDKRDCITAAWGQQNCSGLKGLHSILGRAELSTETHRYDCETDWQHYLEDRTFKLKNNQFCTKRKHSAEDSCFCDHGAALCCPIESNASETQYEQIGVSIATGGCTKDLPGIFSSVSEHRVSIDRIFAEKGFDSSYYTP